MADPVIFESGEKLVRLVLNAELPKYGFTARTSTQFPDPRPDQFIVVSRVGGNRLNMIQAEPRILVECYAKDELVADRLARTAHAILTCIESQDIGDTWVYFIREAASLIENYDVTREIPRRQFEVGIRHRGKNLIPA